MNIPTPRTAAHDQAARLVLADGHIHAGLPVTIVQPVGSTSYMVRIGDDPAKITPQVVAADQILIVKEEQ